MAFLDSLKKQSNVTNASICELNVDIPYCVLVMKEVDTKFGLATTCVLRNDVTGGTINVFLPKSIQITGEDITQYNLGNVPRVSLIYRGKNRGRFTIDFQ